MSGARRVSRDSWDAAVGEAAQGYLSASFAELNSRKCREVHYLLCGSAGIILGEREGWLLSPFSAPYGGFTGHDSGAAAMLADYCRAKRLGCEITLPASVYGAKTLKEAGELLNARFSLSAVDANYHYSYPGTDFESLLGVTGRKKLRHALRENPDIREGGPELLSEAYAIIERNRSERGYPLKMSLEEMRLTAGIIPTDCFVVRIGEDGPAASAIVHRTMPDAAQVVYWGNTQGDDRAYGANFPIMHALVGAVYCHYRRQPGMRLLDTGPASDRGLILPGLAQFKERMGCLRSDKLTFKMLAE